MIIKCYEYHYQIIVEWAPNRISLNVEKWYTFLGNSEKICKNATSQAKRNAYPVRGAHFAFQ